jgi:hypothetical protein
LLQSNEPASSSSLPNSSIPGSASAIPEAFAVEPQGHRDDDCGAETSAAASTKKKKKRKKRKNNAKNREESWERDFPPQPAADPRAQQAVTFSDHLVAKHRVPVPPAANPKRASVDGAAGTLLSEVNATSTSSDVDRRKGRKPEPKKTAPPATTTNNQPRQQHPLVKAAQSEVAMQHRSKTGEKCEAKKLQMRIEHCPGSTLQFDPPRTRRRCLYYLEGELDYLDTERRLLEHDSRYMNISAMTAYGGLSAEELRFRDYSGDRRFPEEPDHVGERFQQNLRISLSSSNLSGLRGDTSTPTAESTADEVPRGVPQGSAWWTGSDGEVVRERLEFCFGPHIWES